MINISNKYNLTVFHISDLHGTHQGLKVPEADIMIVSGVSSEIMHVIFIDIKP